MIVRNCSALVVIQPRAAAMAMGRAVHRHIMHEDEVPVLGLTNVDFNQVRSDLNGFFNRLNRVLRGAQERPPSMSHDLDPRPLVGPLPA